MWGNKTYQVVLAGLVAVMALGCGPKHQGFSDEFQQTLSEWSAGKALEEGVARQTVGAAPRGATDHLDPGEPIWIQSGKSRIIRLAQPVKRVSIANPELAGIVVLGPTTLMINAKPLPEGLARQSSRRSSASAGIGTSERVTGRTLTPPPDYAETTLVLWDRSGQTASHTVFVANFIGQQVMLEVTVAELNRTAFEEHGIDFQNLNSTFSSNFFLGGGGPPIDGILGPLPLGSQQLLPLFTEAGKPTFAFRLPDEDITAFIQVLQREGLATILAQPKIMALSGQPAVFQVGGEIPIRIVSSFIASIEFKPFGTLVSFLPQVTEEGDIFLTVTPEVSQPDFNSPVEGIPTFRTRRASTSARLRDGETLILGGLLQTNRIEDVRGIPYLQDIPVVGHFFRHTTYTDEVTELMVMATPRLVQPIADGEHILLPTDREPLTNEEIRTKPHPAKATRPRIPGLGTGATVPGLP
jgi:Flp pilus assembly secretin CpaC